MQILLIGGSGFVGRAISELFLSQGDRVAVLSRGNKPVPKGTEALIGDRQKADSFSKGINGRSFDLVVDITAFSAPDVDAVMPALAGRCGHYVMISTDFVYATDLEEFPIREDAPKDPDSKYGQGKLAAEQAMLAAWKNLKIPGTALRPPHIMGAGKELGTSSVQGRDKNLLRSMRAGTGLTLLGEGELLLQPVWNRQIAEAISACAGKDKTFGQVMNMPGAEIVTVRRYYQLIADRLKVPLKYDSVSVEQYRKDHPGGRAAARHRVYDTSKLRDLAGFVAKPQLREAIDETVTWMESNC